MTVTARHPKSDILQITQSITGICDHLIHVVRTMMYQLHSHILTELGLIAALDDMIKHWKERNPHLSIAVDCSDEMDSRLKLVAHYFNSFLHATQTKARFYSIDITTYTVIDYR
jgi:signal transduction histidine kinase